MTRKFSWGIIGGGFISSQFAKGIEKIEDQRVGAIASRSGNKSKILAERYYTDYEELIRDETIDAVYIGTIHPEHYRNVKRCLEMGKPVLCEKPIVMNTAELKELVKISEEKKIFLMEAMWTRFLPLCIYMKEKFLNGEFGRILHMQISFGEKAELSKQRLFKANLGGGALMDIGVYGISFAEWLLQENPDDIRAWSRKNEEKVDLTTFVQMHYPNGCDVELTASIEKQLPNSAVITTDKGEFVVPYFWRPDTLLCYELNHDFKVDRLLKTKVCPIEGNGYQYEAIAACHSIKEHAFEHNFMPHKSSLNVMNTLDVIRKKCGIYCDI